MDDDNKTAESDIDDLNLTNSRLNLSAPKRFGKQKGSGIAFPFPISATDFLVKVIMKY